MSKLLVHPTAPDGDGRILAVTPESAGWGYVGFEVYTLAPGQAVTRPTGGTEVCLVLVSGKARVEGAGQDFGVIGERMSPFEGNPWSVYLPPGTRWTAGERLLYHVTPYALKDWLFYSFLAGRFDRRRMAHTNYRVQNWQKPG